MHRLASLDKICLWGNDSVKLTSSSHEEEQSFSEMGIRVYDVKIGKVKIIAASVRQKRAPPWNSFSSAMLFGCVIAVDQGWQVFDTLFPAWSQSHTLFNPLTIWSD